MAKKKKKETGISDLLKIIPATNEKITDCVNEMKLVDASSYIHAYHPIIKNKKIFIRGNEAFALTGSFINLKCAIEKYGVMNDEIKSIVESIILLIKLIDSYNDIEDMVYEWKIKNGVLYIL